MNWKSILRFKAMGVVLAVALMMIPVSYVAATENDFDWRLGHYDRLIADPIKTDAGYVSGTMIDVVQRCWIDVYDRLTGKVTCASTLLGEVGKPVRVYRGIPYAAPPVGNLRWKPPQPVTPWEGIRECTKSSPVAPQTPYPMSFFWGSIPESGMSEDCLYLSVATPARHSHERLPVMVWFHGGGINTGTNSPDGAYPYFAAEGASPAPLANKGVVIVAIQHRIGPLGYMAHPELTAESPDHASGNYGQLDLIAALKWVKKNIAEFGGDPHNVTIFGQSGGGSKTLWLLASPLAKGLFQKALVESGCAISGPSLNPMSMCYSLSDAQQAGLKLQAKAGASNLADLRVKKWQDIVNAVSGSGYVDNFTVDGWSLTDSLYNTFKAGKQNDVPYIIGAAEGEPLKHQGIQLWADALVTGKSKVYVYLMAQVPSNWKSQGVLAWHASDVAYEWGDLTALDLFAGALVPATVNRDPGVTEQDVWVSEYMMNMLAQFAETGNPSVEGVPWPPFSLKSGKDWYIDIVYPVKAKTGYMGLFK